MATTINFEAHSQGSDGRTGKVTGTLSLNDVTVNTTPNATGGFNTATVTADKQTKIFVGPTDAASAGIPIGWYEAATGPGAGNLFRRTA
jgi:hypothetical protein